MPRLPQVSYLFKSLIGATPETCAQSRFCRSPPTLTLRANRQAHREHRPLARLACQCHVAAHHARELAREGKAEPRPAVAARGERIRLGEFLEQFRPLFSGQAD